MTDCEGEVRLLRQRVAELEELLERLEAGAVEGEACLVGTTFSQGSYPTVAGRFYAFHPATVTGTETEGSTATVATGSEIVLAANLGTTVPPTGTSIPIDRVRHRWAFRYDG